MSIIINNVSITIPDFISKCHLISYIALSMTWLKMTAFTISGKTVLKAA